ncbi:MAG TPA: hypothetical protein VK731_08345 [Candidatus Cybelea sp.]|nr:hypothetical protein [Candidatus Cybelea sp.]
MKRTLAPCLAIALAFMRGFADAAEGVAAMPENRKLNNLVELLLDIAPATGAQSCSFVRPSAGWIFISFTTRGDGAVQLTLDKATAGEVPIYPSATDGPTREAMHYISQGAHTLQIEGQGAAAIEHLTVKAIPELIYCGLGFEPRFKAYGPYDLNFLKRDILPNITTTIIPNGLKLANSDIEDWHRQGKRYIVEVGINPEAKTADEHAAYWTSFFTNSPFIDGIIIDEFIVNRPISEWMPVVKPERRVRFDAERASYELYAEAFQKIHADTRFTNKLIYAYVGGSGKKLNQEIVGTNAIRSLLHCGYFVSPERYLHEMSSEKGSKEALREFVEGLADWQAKEPGIKKQMIVTFGLFSTPFISLNKQPNVDYHVWMDQQMNLVANEPSLAGLAGLNWWTSLVADEETVRFVGRLYRHYAIEGKTNLLTTDPLFLSHIQNADFEQGTDSWNLHPAETGSIEAKSHPRYGRVEGRYMGLISPPDPEHIGDTFLCMRRSEKGPNTFSQTIKNLQPGRLYSLKMMVCDYDDLIHPKPRKVEDTKSFASVLIDGAEVDATRSFSEVYASDSEPKIPVCITYHWKVFRAKATSATLTVSDWLSPSSPAGPFGQEQAFNFLEIQPYHE